MNTLDQQTALEQAARKHTKDSHALGGDAGRLDHFYRGWASSYDLGLADGYCGPMIAAEMAAAVQTAYLARHRTAMAILDAGCGTGPVGVELESLRFRLIDGFDLSEEMAEKAQQTRAYRNVRGDVDLIGLPSEYFRASYDLTFTLGYVGPDGLRELARVTRSNGFVIASDRKSYADATSFEDHVRLLQDEGVLIPAQYLRNGRYAADEDAHCWVLADSQKDQSNKRTGCDQATSYR
ncbi:class I SAM-dependent methyltransferase [Mesorhizobium sp. M1004]|uniref:class I SAM-dependent DNA methyltransferase n=1 Tax=Mesorhizobium sp. M1004 TaxID=2957046 RepID=UPI0033394BA5